MPDVAPLVEEPALDSASDPDDDSSELLDSPEGEVVGLEESDVEADVAVEADSPLKAELAAKNDPEEISPTASTDLLLKRMIMESMAAYSTAVSASSEMKKNAS